MIFFWNNIIVNGFWSDWSDWGFCSFICGEGGIKKCLWICINFFLVNGGLDCDGFWEEMSECDVRVCLGNLVCF